MKNIKFIYGILSLWLLSVSLVYAQAPNAQLSVHLIENSWPARYTLSLNIPDQHHAYLDKGADNLYIPVNVELANTSAGVTIKQLVNPNGVYDDDVKATVLRGQGDFALNLTANPHQPPAAQAISLAVKYQLCNDQTHECFRPKTAAIEVTLPNAAILPMPDSAEENSSFTDQLLALFKHNSDNTLIMFGLMLIAGLLSVATPCVYPMLPITSMFILRRANGVAEKEKHHAFVYLLGMIATYMLLGLMAGMTGGAFNTFMQSAWVNLAFAIFFAFFALALLGFYELGFMQNEVYSLDQQSAKVSGLAGTCLMGSVAGLVISPCVGPIVFALLLQVADTIAEKSAALAALNQTLSFWDRLTIAGQGSVMMAGFGLGVGLPFFIISVVKFKQLPKAGYWMNKVKYAFGLMILYFAYTYLVKGMGVWGISSQTSLAFALGLVSIWIAVVYCNVFSLLPADALPQQKMQHYCGVISLLLGSWLVVASLSHTPIGTITPSAALMPANATANTLTEQEVGVTWYRSYAQAQKIAQATGKPIFIDFYASWCANCTAFKEEVANNHALNEALRNTAIAVKLVDQEPEFEQFREHPEHRHLKIGLPYFAILNADGSLKWSSTDYKATSKMVAVLTGQAG
ncbi:MAG: cytochrome c biogenesis protein CcdA [Methylococcaceae bacterium]